ncbi:MAG: DUF1223 domain-containing protein [Defluviicoccus sp.]|nr:DUF1223 domain-containing protein [Defluviicoccus sp.]MDE0385351.1 DUF1223 domain-containing protein [Defluviicoccus sp.]
MSMRRLLALAPLLGALVAGAGTARADGPTVVELFTSQGCYSCPPAERFLGELADRDGVLALEFHVDYWDNLTYGSAGKWKDPYSSPAFTARQRRYNVEIRRRTGVYTPQMVVDGKFEVVGSREGAVEMAIEDARARAGARVAVAAVAQGGGLRVSLKGGPDRAGGVWLVSFLRREATRVLRGENHGKLLVNHNIVTEMRRIGEWDGKERTIDVAAVANDEKRGCAVLVQAGAAGPILGAAHCPAAGS